MDLFHKLIDLIDRNAEKIPEGDYLELCNTIKELREKVQPPPFLIDRNEPMTYTPDTANRIYQRWLELDNEEGLAHPGLDVILRELHEEWAATDHDGPVEPGFFYPPSRDDTLVVEVSLSE